MTMRLIGVLAIIGLAGCEVDPETGLAEIDPEAIAASEDGASEIEEAAVWDDAGALARDRDDDDDDGHHGGHDRDDDDDDGHHGGHDRDDDDDDGHHGGHDRDDDDDDGHHGHKGHDGHHRSMAGDAWMDEFDAIDVESLDVEELDAPEYADPEL